MTAKLVPPELINLDNQIEDFLAMQRGEISDPVADYLNAHPPKEKPWKLKCALCLAAIAFFWWEFGEYVMRMAR